VGEDLRPIRAYIRITDGVITRIYESKPVHIDIYFEDSVIVPGFINMHTHIADSIAKEKAYGLSVEEAVAPPDGLKHRILREASKDEIIDGIRTAIREMLGCGITTFVDFREGGSSGVEVLREAIAGTGINAIILGRPDGATIGEILAVSDGIGLSSINHYDDQYLRRVNKYAKKYNKIVAYHASETPRQRQKSIERHGTSDIVRGVRLLDPDFIVHITYADEGDLRFLSTRKSFVVLCPRANGYFGHIPPIASVLKYGIEFGIGTDNIMINSPNIFREFDYIIRIARTQGITIPLKMLLKSVTTTPAKRLSLKTGCIAEGYKADLIIFDLSKPNVSYIDDPITAIVARGSTQNIKQVYLSGREVE